MRRHGRDAKHKRDPGAFLAIPMSVLHSEAYKGLSAHSVRLLWDIACQYRGDNNGQLYAAWTLMRERGWRSEDTLAKAKRELLEHGFLYETRKGHRPNKASWYALTWWATDDIIGMDVSPQSVPRGEYRRFTRIGRPSTAGGAGKP